MKKNKKNTTVSLRRIKYVHHCLLSNKCKTRRPNFESHYIGLPYEGRGRVREESSPVRRDTASQGQREAGVYGEGVRPGDRSYREGMGTERTEEGKDRGENRDYVFTSDLGTYLHTLVKSIT